VILRSEKTAFVFTARCSGKGSTASPAPAAAQAAANVAPIAVKPTPEQEPPRPRPIRQGTVITAALQASQVIH
jgi:hypothetical protein